MAVLVKGMKMPFTCLSCDFHKCAGGVGDYCTLTKKKQFRFKNRPLYCPLISVPEPYGRLIDAEETRKLFGRGLFEKIVNDILDNVPTVIPASEEGE